MDSVVVSLSWRYWAKSALGLDEELLDLWLVAPHSMLDYKTPIEIIGMGQIERVELIFRVRLGQFAI